MSGHSFFVRGVPYPIVVTLTILVDWRSVSWGAFDRVFSGITDGIYGVDAEALTRTTYNVGLDEFYSLFRYFSLESSSGLT